MAPGIDWMNEAAREIVQFGSREYDLYLTQAEAREIIEKHSPFKPDVAYMPVPRCETCAHWQSSTKACAALRSGPLSCIYTAPDFGCVKWKAR